MAWITFQIWPRDGALLPVHWKVVCGLRRARAQALLFEVGGRSSLGANESSSHESDSL